MTEVTYYSETKPVSDGPKIDSMLILPFFYQYNIIFPILNGQDLAVPHDQLFSQFSITIFGSPTTLCCGDD